MGTNNSRYSDRRLKRKIRGLGRIFEECVTTLTPGKRRFAFYEYLESVYELFREMGGASTAGKEMAKRMAEMYDINVRKKDELFRVLIDASSSQVDPKMVSRWVRGLGYIWRKRQEWTSWRQFVEAHSGIAGCARAIAKVKKEFRAAASQRTNRDLAAARERTGMRKRLMLTATGSSAEAKWPLALPTGNRLTPTK